MELSFEPRGVIKIDGARLIFRNFSGAPGKYNREGDRSFSIVIPSEKIAEALVKDKNRFGVGWNVVVKEPKEEGDTPLMHLKVKVKFNDRGPTVRLISGKRKVKLDEESISMLDNIDIASADLDIRPYDDEINGKPFRAAYLKGIRVYQEFDRFDDDDEEDYEE